MDKATKDKVKKLIKEALNEVSINAKKKNEKNASDVFKTGKGGYNGIRTFGIVTAENPNSQQISRSKNKYLMKTFSGSLKSAHYAFVKQTGHFGGNNETSYFIFNIPLEALIYYAGLYEQTSFFYCYVNDGKVNSQYWQKKIENEPFDKEKNPYIMLEETDQWIDASGKEDYSIIGNKFKYTIPLKIFESVDNTIIANSKTFVNESFEEVMHLANECVGETAWFYRNKLYKGLF